AGPSTALAILGLVPIGVALWRRRWPEWCTLVLGILALGFLAMVIRSQRIMEYFPAFGVIFCAWSWSHAPETLGILAPLARPRLPPPATGRPLAGRDRGGAVRHHQHAGGLEAGDRRPGLDHLPRRSPLAGSAHAGRLARLHDWLG